MYYQVTIEALCSGVTEDGDLGDRLLTLLELAESQGSISAPAVGEDLKASTIGATVCVDDEPDALRAAERVRSVFLGALRRLGVGLVVVVDIEVKMQREEAAALA